jgi:4-hydroxy-tetrahydrodipicolinate reductase
MYQLLHVGLGPLGQRVIADLDRRRLGRVVAAVDPAPALARRDLADLVPGLARGVAVRSSLEEVAEWDRIRCAVVTTRSDLELCMDTFRVLLARGCAVVSTCEELAWPWLRHPVLAQELHELAVRGGGRIVGTGINPGFLMDALPVAATSACHSVSSIRVERIQDAGKRRIPFQEKVGVGLTLAEFERRVAAGTLRHVGLGESLHFLAHYLGWRIERWEETIAPVVAEQALTSARGPVAAGAARGVRQEARAWVDGRLALELFFQATLGEPEPRDRVRIEGEPPLELVVPGGVHGDTATSALVLNVIRSLLAAEPGLHTMASLPLQGCAPPNGA